jgi:hypothetical protein
MNQCFNIVYLAGGFTHALNDVLHGAERERLCVSDRTAKHANPPRVCSGSMLSKKCTGAVGFAHWRAFSANAWLSVGLIGEHQG